MSKASDRRSERLRQMQEAAKAKERNRNLLIAGSAAVVVIAIVVVFVIVKVVSGNGSSAQTPVSQKGVTEVVRDVTNVPLATLNKVGVGTAEPSFRVIKGAPSITSGGKPEVLFVGAEFCPYCAATRWGLVAALSRFGTFTNLGLTSSEADDYAPDTATLEFYKSSYSSPYVTFRPYETETRSRAPLQNPSGSDEQTFVTYDSPPYVSSESRGAIPFMDFGGKYFGYGAPFDPLKLADLSHKEIAEALKDPSSPTAQLIDGAANFYTAVVCKMTGQQPGSVCTQPGVKAAAAKLPTGS